ncbi:hypothetical protein QUB47_32320 [Microcoleus sp. AT9_B5]
MRKRHGDVSGAISVRKQHGVACGAQSNDDYYLSVFQLSEISKLAGNFSASNCTFKPVPMAAVDAIGRRAVAAGDNLP